MNNRENWLVKELDRPDLSDKLRTAYEAELDNIADCHTKTQQKQAEAGRVEEQRRTEIRERILAGDEDLIETLGSEEFGSDYETVHEGSEFVVYSKVCRDHQDSRHPCPTAEAARLKLRRLLWDRLYTRYVRGGEVDSLKQLGA